MNPGLSLANNCQAHTLRGFGLSPIAEILTAYLLAAKVDQKSLSTIDSYQERLSIFIRYLEAHNLPLDPNQITSLHLRLFLGHLRDKNLNSSTVNAYYRTLQTFFRWIVAERITTNYPLHNIKPPRITHSVIRPFSSKDIESLFSLCGDITFQHLRNRAILMILLDTGLRLSEVSNIRLKDIDFNHETIMVLGKGNKERVVRIGKLAQKTLMRYLLARRKSDQTNLWLTGWGTAMRKNGLQTTIERLCIRAGITDARPSTHTFRHTSAINFLRNGGSEFLLQIMLGHTTLAMTRRYVSTLGTDDLIRAHIKASPVDNMRFIIDMAQLHQSGKNGKLHSNTKKGLAVPKPNIT